MKLRFTKKGVAVGTIVGSVLAGGIAYATWTLPSTGSGSGYAVAGHAVALSTSDAHASVVNKLYPGTTGDLAVTIHNSNPFPVTVTSVTFGDPTTAVAGCTTPALTWTASAPTWVSQNINANSDGTAVVYANALTMGNSSNDCQDATLTLPVSALTGTSNP